MPRKKPYSGKQKKVQLQQKRLKKGNSVSVFLSIISIFEAMPILYSKLRLKADSLYLLLQR